MHNRKSFRLVPLTAALLLAATPALAQQPQKPDASATAESYAQPAAQATSFSDTELKAFAKAREQVESVRTEISAKLQKTQDQQEMQKLQQEANTKMIAAVEAAGLSRQKYNEIARAAMSDPALAEKLAKLQ